MKNWDVIQFISMAIVTKQLIICEWIVISKKIDVNNDFKNE